MVSAAPPVHSGAVFDPPGSVAPWQYAVQVAAAWLQVAVVPCDASEPNVTSAAPSGWLIDVGTTWHSVHATGPESDPPERWRSCAPTATVVAAVSPCVPTGGAALRCSVPARAASPWHELHVIPPRSTIPFTCVATLTLVCV